LSSGAIIRVAVLAVSALALSACSMGGLFGGGSPSPQTQQLANAAATPEQIAAEGAALPAIATECPPIKVRPGAEAIYYYGNGKVGNANDLQYQAVIDKQSRNCTVSNGHILISMGVVGRLLLGPAGNQTSVNLPLRFAVETNDTALFSQAQTNDFVKVVDQIDVPYVGGNNDITIWVGFDTSKSKG
jgi:hypothetical protein